MNINTNLSNNALFTSRASALQAVNVLNKSKEKDKLNNKLNNTLMPEVEVEFRGDGRSEEEILYDEMGKKFSAELDSAYLDENRSVRDGTLGNLHNKYESLYKELFDSELSDKDKEIGLAALNDNFKMSTMWYSKHVESKMMKLEFKTMKEMHDSGQKVDKELNQFYLKQRNAVTNSIMSLSSKVMEYCKGNISVKGISLNEFLNKSNGGRDIDNMTLDQVNGFEASLSSSLSASSNSGNYLDYFGGKSSDVDYKNTDFQDEKSAWLSHYSGLQSILEKYIL